MSTKQAPNIAVGIVSDNEDPEGMGRVKLTFPWRAAEDESNWARIAQPMTGADRGTWFLPEVGDEVLVAFEGEELAHPYVLGSLWNGQDSPPESNDGNNDVKSVTSRESHTLTFDDADDGGIEIETNAGHKITLDDSSGSETITIEDTSGSNVIEFDGTAQELSIEAGAKLSIDAPQVELSADGNMKLDASGVLTLKGALIQLN